jgi:hypothetical protein
MRAQRGTLSSALWACKEFQRPASIVGHRHGSRTRSLTGSFGKSQIIVPRARLRTSEGKTTDAQQGAANLQRRTLIADALIASAYLLD